MLTEQNHTQTEVGDLEAAFHKGLITESELLNAAGEDYGSLVAESPILALRVADRFGGVRVYVPLECGGVEKSPFLGALNQEDAETLIGIYRGEVLPIPTFAKLRAEIRAKEIVSAYMSGITISGIAMSLRISERRVYQVLQNRRAQPLSQGSSVPPRRRTIPSKFRNRKHQTHGAC